MQDYKLKYLPGFLRDLDNAAEYISVKMKNPQAALELVNMIDEAIASHVHFIDYLSQHSTTRVLFYICCLTAFLCIINMIVRHEAYGAGSCVASVCCL